jgi:glycerol kinase
LQAGLLPPPGDAPTHWRLQRRFVPGMAAEEAASRKADWRRAVQSVLSA